MKPGEAMHKLIQFRRILEEGVFPVGYRFDAEPFDLAIAALEQMEQDRWISCTERLPKEGGCYLVTVRNDHERRYSKTAWFGRDGWFARQDVLAWMPLPTPYRQEDKS